MSDVAVFGARRDRVRELLVGTAGLVVTHLPNVRYLTGFSGSNAALFLSADDPLDDLLATDGRYEVQAGEQSPDLPLLIDRQTLPALARGLAGHGIVEVLCEDTASIGEMEALRAGLRAVTPRGGLVEQLRALKEPAEIEVLARACAISAEAFGQVMLEVRPGWAELKVARRLEQLFGELGAEDRAFPTIVGSGPNAAVPHHAPTTRELQVGDLVVIDFGARVDGYHADMTRTAMVGEAAGWQRELHAAVQEAQGAARAHARPGAGLQAVDAVARDLLGRAGLGEAFVHGLGHGVGLQIHEAPMMGRTAVGTLAASMTVTVEPGAYLPGRGGVRIEDTLVVRPDGPHVLTDADRGLWPIGA